MKKLLAAFALLFTAAMAYRYSTDRVRAQLMGAAHPGGALAAVRVPRRRGLLRRGRDDRFDYQAASSIRDHAPIDSRDLVDTPLPAAGIDAPQRPARRAKRPS